MSSASEVEVKIDVASATASSEPEPVRRDVRADTAPGAMELSKMQDVMVAQASLKTSADNTTGKGAGKKEYANASKLWTGDDVRWKITVLYCKRHEGLDILTFFPRQERQLGVWLRVFELKEVNTAKQTAKAQIVLILKWLDHDFARKYSKPKSRGDTRGFFDSAANCPSKPKLRFQNFVQPMKIDVEL